MTGVASGRRFWAVLGLILVAATALRVTYVVTVTRHDVDDVYDSFYYTLQARGLARGEGYVDPVALLEGTPAGPAADHPPLTAVVLIPAAAIPDLGASRLMMRFTIMVFGLAAVVMTGILGRAVAGDRVGLIAAGIAAFSPNFWMNDGLIMSEAPAVFLTALALWCTYRARGSDSWLPVAALGAVCGLAALTRPELALLVPLLVVPVAIRRGRPGPSLQRMAVGGVAALLVVGPWVGFNLSRFEDPVWLSTNDGVSFAGANCDATYYGELVGHFELGCVLPVPPGDQSQQSVALRSRAFDYMRDHADRVPLVMAVRALRTWQVWDPFTHATYDAREGRPVWASTLGILTMWVLFPLVVIGFVVARRRRIAVWPLVVPIALVTGVAVLVLGQVRLRAPAEPAIAVLGSIGVVGLVGRSRPAWRIPARPSDVARDDGVTSDRDDGDPHEAQSRTIDASSSS